jgi:hypothetical protein
MELKGQIYDSSNLCQAYQFASTTQEKAEYVGQEYHYGIDIKRSIKSLKLFKPKKPLPLLLMPRT